MPDTTIVLANLGTPKAPTAAAVRSFLAEFLSDPMVVDFPRWLWWPILHGIILRRRPARVAKLYEAIWSAAGSPLAAGTERTAAALAARCPAGTEVRIAYRYGSPSVREALQGSVAAGARRIALVPLFPQRTGSTTGTLIALAQREAAALGIGERLDAIVPDPDAPGYVTALAARVGAALAAAPAPPERLVVSFHGIPERYDRAERGVYTQDCRRTTDALARAIGWPDDRVTLAFQSRFGPEKWLGPATAGVLAQLPARGVRRVVVTTPGFLADGLETIEEIGVQGRETFLHAGGEVFVRASGAEDHPAMIETLLAAALRA